MFNLVNLKHLQQKLKASNYRFQTFVFVLVLIRRKGVESRKNKEK